VKFKAISNENFPVLSTEVVDDLSTDQHYAYRISFAIMNGHLEDDLRLLEVGPIVHSRWLTLACRILRYYVSQKRPTKNLIILSKFCLLVYFPSFFSIKQRCRFTDGALNFFGILKRVLSFPNNKVRKIATDVLQRNAFFAHSENIIVGMLGSSLDDIRQMGVETVLSLRASEPRSTEVRKFEVPQLNFDAQHFYEMTTNNGDNTEVPPLIKDFSDDEIKELSLYPLTITHPCHNQTVERHVKLVTQASSMVSTFERRDGLIRQRISSRKLIKQFGTKKHFGG
jgi:hypothetical protein